MVDAIKRNWILLAILSIGAALRLLGVDWGLPYQYQTEEYRVIKYALRMGSGDFNPHIFEYPSLYLYFVLFLYGGYYCLGRALGWFASAAEFARLYITDPTNFHIIGRAAEAFFGIGIVFMTYHIGKKIFSERVGLLAAFCYAILPSAVYTAHATKGDMAAFFLGLVFWNFCWDISERAENKDYIFAGAIFGLMISTKYIPGIIGIALPVAHWMGPRRWNMGPLLISLLLIPVFFIFGTPYAALSPEFANEFKSMFFTFGSGKANYWETQTVAAFYDRYSRVTINLFRMFDWPTTSWIGNYGLGLVNFLGLICLAVQKRRAALLIGIPIFLFWFFVAFIPSPAAGYLQPIFPLFILSGVYWVSESFDALRQNINASRWTLPNVARSGVIAFFLIAVCLLFKWSAVMAYAYTLKDTRTLAKEWIDANLPTGSKVLMDLLPFSPPIEMSRGQLEKFYQKAVELNHYKKEYFKLKLETYKDEQPGYDIFVIKRMPSQLGVLPRHLEEVQKTQDLIDIDDNDNAWRDIGRAGIRYLIISEWSELNALRNNMKHSYYYQTVGRHATLIYELKPTSSIHPGPSIRIYQLASQPRIRQ